MEICHGSPFDEDTYIFDEMDALHALKISSRPLCLFGHTHYPVTFELNGDALSHKGPAAAADTTIALREGVKYLMNPGSVGQPRDGNPLCSFAIYDSETRMVSIHRLSYPLRRTQEKILKAGLPRPLADRLALGR